MHDIDYYYKKSIYHDKEKRFEFVPANNVCRFQFLELLISLGRAAYNNAEKEGKLKGMS